jgi:hypothetical protein
MSKPPPHPKKAPQSVLTRLLGIGKKISSERARKRMLPKRLRVVASAEAISLNQRSIVSPQMQKGIIMRRATARVKRSVRFIG